jgi:hypothetical protein
MRWGAARAESPPELMDHFFALAFFVFFAFAFFAFLAIVSSSFAGRPLWAGLRPHTIVESPDSVGLSAKEPMNLVDKRLDKATAPRLLWVIIDRGRELCRPAQVRFAPKDGVIGRQLVDS